jgi:hypothetical protein
MLSVEQKDTAINLKWYQQIESDGHGDTDRNLSDGHGDTDRNLSDGHGGTDRNLSDGHGDTDRNISDGHGGTDRNLSDGHGGTDRNLSDGHGDTDRNLSDGHGGTDRNLSDGHGGTDKINCPLGRRLVILGMPKPEAFTWHRNCSSKFSRGFLVVIPGGYQTGILQKQQQKIEMFICSGHPSAYLWVSQIKMGISKTNCLPLKIESASSQQRSYYAFGKVLSQYTSKFLPGLHQCWVDISF